jgi:hypothetical protein
MHFISRKREKGKEKIIFASSSRFLYIVSNALPDFRFVTFYFNGFAGFLPDVIQGLGAGDEKAAERGITP